jgi:hypothetical protein
VQQAPIIFSIAAKNKNTSLFLEMHFLDASLLSFVVESKTDYDLLYKHVQEKFEIPINIIALVQPVFALLDDMIMRSITDNAIVQPPIICQYFMKKQSIGPLTMLRILMVGVVLMILGPSKMMMILKWDSGNCKLTWPVFLIVLCEPLFYSYNVSTNLHGNSPNQVFNIPVIDRVA